MAAARSALHPAAVPPLRWGVVVPVKGGPGAKSRLQGVGAPGLALAMALDCLGAVLACERVGEVVVVTGDPVAAAAVEELGAAALDDPGRGLDAAAQRGLQALDAAAPRAVLLADLPCLRPGDLVDALDAAARHPSAVVPDADGGGTVLLALPAGALRATRFGPGSAAAHQQDGAVLLPLRLPRLRRDVDTPDDLAAARALGVGARTAEVLATRGAPSGASLSPRA